ncbi:P-loop containing nucleoside triphosphate hydrolase protein [Lipomyces orientalis]|uniref:P-loop containing nucleoside triphosphate hydrolase protein n=1 Tax=Lipomyces orientalis TaxID=1233043 RepID=A0ACC3TIB1_9ASCO
MVQKQYRHASGLGHAIINSRNNARRSQRSGPDGTDLYHEQRQPNWMRLQSVTQERDLDEFLSTAELAGTDFTATKLNIKILHQDQQNPYLLTPEQELETNQRQQSNRQRLTVPRRPAWDDTTTPGELDRRERAAFLEWRRGLAELEERHDLLLTPFERNLEVWRQLWRVVERSSVVVQICDARNPLFYRSQDLEIYVRQLAETDGKDKRNLLLINKADMLTVRQRRLWARYFKREGISFAFFSAAMAGLEDAFAVLNIGNEVRQELNFEQDLDDVTAEDIHVLSVDELEALFLKTAPPTENETDKIYIGLVGYPNVGKSSTINALIGAKKVSVSATPGKTKHFQTIHLSDKVVLCDCPGLVFPNFASTKADLVCNGVLPIDQLREYTGPAALVAKRIPKEYIEKVYGIKIHARPEIDGGTGIPTADELLGAYAVARGLIRSSKGGRPDESKAARVILKDFVKGKLLYCQPPPGEDPVEYNRPTYAI